MSGTISSLGLGSGTLTSDVIDSLREADESILVTPIDNDIDENQEKISDLSTLTTIIAGLKTTTSELADDSLYLDRSTSVTGSSVTATADSGVDIQNISINVEQLAEQSVFQSASTFSSLDDNIITSGTDNTFEFYVGSSKKTVELEDGAVSVSALIEAINDQYGDSVTASSLNVGDGQYKFILKSDETGYDNQIWFGNSTNSVDVDFTTPFTADVSDITIDGNEILTSSITADSMTELVQQLNDAVASNEDLNVFFMEDGDSFKVVSTDGEEVSLGGALFGQPTLDVSTASVTSSGVTRDRDTYTEDGQFIKTIDSNFDSGTKVRAEAMAVRDNTDTVVGYIEIQELTDGTFNIIRKNDDGSVIEDSTNVATEDDIATYIDANYDATHRSAFYTYSERAPSGVVITENTSNNILNNMGMEQLTKATDAKFTFSGVEIRRDSNVVTDLIVGLNLELQETGSSTVKIDRDDDGLKDTLTEMVAAYNQVLNKLSDLTDFDEETGTSGTFQGVSEITRIKSNLNRLLLSSDFSQDIHNLVDLGLELNESGLLTFDEDTFNEKLSEDPEAIEKFFKGYTSTVNGKEIEYEGVFTQMNDLLDGLIGDEGTLTYMDTSLNNRGESLEEEREKAVERLDARYEIMEAKFAAYDSIIATMTNNFSSLQMQIDSMTSSDD